MPSPARPETLERLKAIVGSAGFSVDPDEIAPHLVEWRNRFVGKTPLLLKPASTILPSVCKTIALAISLLLLKSVRTTPDWPKVLSGAPFSR